MTERSTLSRLLDTAAVVNLSRAVRQDASNPLAEHHQIESIGLPHSWPVHGATVPPKGGTLLPEKLRPPPAR